MRLVIDGDSIKFEPDFKDFEIVLINVYDVMMKAVTIVPRVETKLYSEWVRNVSLFSAQDRVLFGVFVRQSSFYHFLL